MFLNACQNILSVNFNNKYSIPIKLKLNNPKVSLKYSNIYSDGYYIYVGTCFNLFPNLAT